MKDKTTSLPYIFKAPLMLNKRIDVKKMQFGSKIDKDSVTKRDQFYVVKEVINTAFIRLNNDIVIKLIGIQEKPTVNREAIAFLNKSVLGKRVFLKYDCDKYDSANNLLCYLYLENKTFINAHLVKKGLAFVDKESDFKYKTKFLTLAP